MAFQGLDSGRKINNEISNIPEGKAYPLKKNIHFMKEYLKSCEG